MYPSLLFVHHPSIVAVLHIVEQEGRSGGYSPGVWTVLHIVDRCCFWSRACARVREEKAERTVLRKTPEESDRCHSLFAFNGVLHLGYPLFLLFSQFWHLQSLSFSPLCAESDDSGGQEPWVLPTVKRVIFMGERGPKSKDQQ